MNDLEKKMKKMEKTKKPLKKFKAGEFDIPTKLEPYTRGKISVRDIEDFMEEEDDQYDPE